MGVFLLATHKQNLTPAFGYGGSGVNVRQLGGDRAGEMRITRRLRNRKVTIIEMTSRRWNEPAPGWLAGMYLQFRTHRLCAWTRKGWVCRSIRCLRWTPTKERFLDWSTTSF